MVTKEFATSQELWEWINETLCSPGDSSIKNLGAVRHGNELSLYEVYWVVHKAWIDPKFDFGRTLYYRLTKWKSLVSNYINRNHLDLVKSEIQAREMRKNYIYNIGMDFDNSHTSGKGCLLSMILSRKGPREWPILTCVLRASEVTKRLPFDLLLMQRVGEFIYGKAVSVELRIFCPDMYQTTDGAIMYNNHKPIMEGVTLDDEPKSSFYRKCIEGFQKYSNVDLNSIKYRVSLRTAQSIRQGKDHPFRPRMREIDMPLYEDLAEPKKITLLKKKK